MKPVWLSNGVIIHKANDTPACCLNATVSRAIQSAGILVFNDYHILASEVSLCPRQQVRIVVNHKDNLKRRWLLG
jgi:hypothetical protein